MSSIRRSSLTSITLGLPTVIGGYLSFASLEEAAGQCLECPLEPCIRARRYGAGRPVLLLRWRLGPARFGSYDDATVQAGCHAPASDAVTAVTDYSLSNPLFFGRRVIDVQSPKRRLPTTAFVQKLHSLRARIAAASDCRTIAIYERTRAPSTVDVFTLAVISQLREKLPRGARKACQRCLAASLRLTS